MQCNVVASLSLAPWKNSIVIAGYCLPPERRAGRISLLAGPQGWFGGWLFQRLIDCFYEQEERNGETSGGENICGKGPSTKLRVVVDVCGLSNGYSLKNLRSFVQNELRGPGWAKAEI